MAVRIPAVPLSVPTGVLLLISWEIHDPKTVKNCCSRKVNLLCSSSLRSRALCSQTSRNCLRLPGALAADRVHTVALKSVFGASEIGSSFSLTLMEHCCPPQPHPSWLFLLIKQASTKVETDTQSPPGEGTNRMAAGAFSGTECSLPRDSRASLHSAAD